MVINLVSSNKNHDPLYRPNYALLNVRDELARLPGVGNIEIGGAGEYSMRVRIDPKKVAARG